MKQRSDRKSNRMMMYTEIAGMVLMAYMIGSIPTAVWVGKIFFGKDVREHGSGNAGATNMIRVLGYGAGIPVLLFDVFKGFLSVNLTWFFNPELSSGGVVWFRIGLALAAVVGHIYPLWAGFRGGKGVGTLAGVGIALYPWAFLMVLGTFILMLVLTRYVSVSSITASVLFPLFVVLFTGERHTGLIALAIFVALFVPFTHRSNIRRLIRKEEKRFDFRRRKSRE